MTSLYRLALGAISLSLMVLGGVPHPVRAWGATEESDTLPNGLRVIMLRQPASPVVSMQVFIKAGAAAEAGRSEYGLAHLLEHMAFKGAGRHPQPGHISSLVERNGGSLNAYTSGDATVYYINMPREQVALGLDILSDLVFSPIYDPAQYALEKEVVIEEIKKNLDHPDRMLMEKFFNLAYPEHPYGRPVIGFEDTVRGASLEEARAFHSRHYRPDNAILVVTGGFDPQEAEAAVRQYFAPLPKPAGPPSPGPAADPAPPHGPRTIVMKSDQAALAKIALGFRGPAANSPETPALDMLSSVLSDGQASRLVEVVQHQKKLVTSISAFSYTPKFPGNFFISLETEPALAEQAVQAVWEELAGLTLRPPAGEELTRARALTEKHFLMSQESAQGLAANVLHFESLLGDFRLKDAYLPLLNRVTQADLLREASRIFRPENLTIAAMLPQNAEAEFSEDTLKSLAGQFSFSAAPESARAVGGFEAATLAGGARLLVQHDPTLPLVTVQVAALGGLLAEDEQEQGLVNFMAQVWPKATAARPAEDLARAIENLGAEITGFSGRNSEGLTGSFLASNWESGLNLMLDILTRPAFDPADLDKVRPEIAAQIKAQHEQLPTRVFQLLNTNLFKGHPYRLDQLGSLATVEKFQARDLQAMYGRLIRPDRLVIVAAGDLDPQKLKTLLEARLKDWPPAAETVRVAPPPAPLAIAEFQEVSQQLDRAQTHLALGFQAPGLGSPEQPALDLLSAYLSGMSGPLFRELRDQKSLAYTTMAAYNPGLGTGSFSFYIATDPAKADEALKGFYEIIERVKKEGLTDEELAGAKRFLIGAIKQRGQTLAARSTRALLNDLYGLGPDFETAYIAALEKTTAAAVLEAARAYLTRDRGVLAVLGKR